MFKIEFETENAAFADDFSGEVERILLTITKAVKEGWKGGNIRDTNGGKVGKWSCYSNTFNE